MIITFKDDKDEGDKFHLRQEWSTISPLFLNHVELSISALK